MILADFTLQDSLANIAVDEAMLDVAEASAMEAQGESAFDATDSASSEVLRLWEPNSPVVVLGRSSPFETEVNHAYCARHGVPIVRRCSGGQSVVTGPGCLMYAVLLDYRLRPELRMLDVAHAFVMNKMRDALLGVGITTEISGTSDLTLDGRKVSGNSLRCKRHWLIYHGTMICDLDIDLIANCLGQPARQPEYRSQRSHREFLVQLDTTVDQLKAAIAKTWNAEPGGYQWPQDQTRRLLESKYRTAEWTQKV